MRISIAKLINTMSISFQKLKKRSAPEMNERIPKKSGRFDGLTEDDVKKNTLEDILKPDLDLVFVGINPSLMAAHTGRYYAGPGNHFYKLLYESNLIPEPITYENDDRLLEYNIGLTNIVARATRSSADLSRSEIKKGAMLVQDKLKRFKPKIAIFNGKCIYEEFDDKYNKASFCFGLQPQRVGSTVLWVVPSSSARCANFPRMQDKLHFYTSLKTYLAYLKGEIEEVNPEDFRFEGRCKQAIPTTSKMWRRKGLSAFVHGGRIVNKETVCMDTSEENVLAIPKSSEFIIENLKKDDSDKSEKDSGISACQSDNSQESEFQINKTEVNRDIKISENNSVTQENRPKTRQLKKTSCKEKLQSKNIENVPIRERTETIDFVSLIKQRLSTKEQSNKEDKDNDGNEKSTKVNKKGLKFENLRSSRSKEGFKLKTSNSDKTSD